MDTYSRHAYLYSAWTAMMIPCALTSAMVYHYVPAPFLQNMWNVIITATPIAVYLALGYFLRDRMRVTSKLLFQFPLFKEDETQMPTTDLLMWSSDYSDEKKIAIRKKVKKDFNYMMPNREDEQKDEAAARKNIAAIVSSMRIKAREAGDVVYCQANYRYGFNRNLLGGLVWAFLFTVLLMVINAFVTAICNIWFIIALLLIALVWMLEYFVLYKYSARNYARQLFDTYLTYK